MGWGDDSQGMIFQQFGRDYAATWWGKNAGAVIAHEKKVHLVMGVGLLLLAAYLMMAFLIIWKAL
jgi:hypothetical protein